MIAREKLNSLVVAKLESGTFRAVTLYDMMRRDNPKVLAEEKVRGFRSFVKIINSFSEVKYIEKGAGYYTKKTLK